MINYSNDDYGNKASLIIAMITDCHHKDTENGVSLSGAMPASLIVFNMKLKILYFSVNCIALK